MTNTLNIGDIVICPLFCDPIAFSKLLGMVIGIGSEITVLQGDESVHFYDKNDLTVLSSYQDVLTAITAKGVELVDRAEQG